MFITGDNNLIIIKICIYCEIQEGLGLHYAECP